ncbi:serine protease [Patescibacteria group bacterium]|nr:serine protease [Patescibacteria group bacterium]
MKPRISPTSPKVKKKNNHDIDDLYHDSFQTIERPAKNRSASTVVILILAMVVSFISGFIGQFVLLTYGSEIPVINKFNLFEPPDSSALVLARLGKDQALSAPEVETLANELSATVVQVFEKKNPSEINGQFYLSDDRLGDGFILTNDGYLVTNIDFINPDSALVVMTHDGEVYDVESVVLDSATKFAFLKIKASGLETVGITDIKDVYSSEDVLSIRQHGINNRPAAMRIQVVNPRFQPNRNIDDMVRVTESYASSVLLSKVTDPSMLRTIVFTLDRKALGILDNRGSQSLVLPFTYIIPILEQVFDGQGITRPLLGVRYINLAHINASPVFLDSAITSGALIYSNDEESSPSIIENSPAAKAGLLSGDVITEISGNSVDDQTELSSLILQKSVGDTITVKYIRDGASDEINLTLE